MVPAILLIDFYIYMYKACSVSLHCTLTEQALKDGLNTLQAVLNTYTGCTGGGGPLCTLAHFRFAHWPIFGLRIRLRTTFTGQQANTTSISN